MRFSVPVTGEAVAPAFGAAAARKCPGALPLETGLLQGLSCWNVLRKEPASCWEFRRDPVVAGCDEKMVSAILLEPKGADGEVEFRPEVVGFCTFGTNLKPSSGVGDLLVADRPAGCGTAGAGPYLVRDRDGIRSTRPPLVTSPFSSWMPRPSSSHRSSSVSAGPRIVRPQKKPPPFERSGSEALQGRLIPDSGSCGAGSERSVSHLHWGCSRYSTPLEALARELSTPQVESPWLVKCDTLRLDQATAESEDGGFSKSWPISIWAKQGRNGRERRRGTGIARHSATASSDSAPPGHRPEPGRPAKFRALPSATGLEWGASDDDVVYEYPTTEPATKLPSPTRISSG